MTGFWAFLRNRPVQGLLIALVFSVVLVLMLGQGGLPFHRPAVRTAAPIANVVTQLMQLVFALFVIAVAFNVTRRREPVDFAARTPEKEIAKSWVLHGGGGCGSPVGIRWPGPGAYSCHALCEESRVRTGNAESWYETRGHSQAARLQMGSTRGSGVLRDSKERVRDQYTRPARR